MYMESSNFIISIQDLLKGHNVDFDNADPKRIRLMRHSFSCDVHKDSIIYNVFKGTIYELYRADFDNFLIYQSEQKETTLENVDYIVSFIGERDGDTRFIGVYRNYGKKEKTESGNYLHDLREVEGFEKLRERVLVKWGYAQGFLFKWENLKEVICIEKEITREKVPLFYRYEDVKLSYAQLTKVVQIPEWQSKLEACNCVYLILDTSNGKQYVGVTYKDKKRHGLKNGILSRWTEYAKTGHGGNKQLQQLLCDNGDIYAENFQWCILETLPLNVLPDSAVERETLWKDKLGTREFGYNSN